MTADPTPTTEAVRDAEQWMARHHEDGARLARAFRKVHRLSALATPSVADDVWRDVASEFMRYDDSTPSSPAEPPVADLRAADPLFRLGSVDMLDDSIGDLITDHLYEIHGIDTRSGTPDEVATASHLADHERGRSEADGEEIGSWVDHGPTEFYMGRWMTLAALRDPAPLASSPEPLRADGHTLTCQVLREASCYCRPRSALKAEAPDPAPPATPSSLDAAPIDGLIADPEAWLRSNWNAPLDGDGFIRMITANSLTLRVVHRIAVRLRESQHGG